VPGIEIALIEVRIGVFAEMVDAKWFRDLRSHAGIVWHLNNVSLPISNDLGDFVGDRARVRNRWSELSPRLNSSFDRLRRMAAELLAWPFCAIIHRGNLEGESLRDSPGPMAFSHEVSPNANTRHFCDRALASVSLTPRGKHEREWESTFRRFGSAN
jgi:hypothetical protein